MNAAELETFVVSQDTKYLGKWNIHPLAISEPWKIVLGNNWDITMSSDPTFTEFYNRLEHTWQQAHVETGDDIMVCEVFVEYTFKAPPGIKSLRYGRHTWADSDQFWHLAGDDKKQWRVVGGFVRTVNMVSVLERSQVDRRDRLDEGRSRAGDPERGILIRSKGPYRHSYEVGG
jgi:hypothetical protein